MALHPIPALCYFCEVMRSLHGVVRLAVLAAALVLAGPTARAGAGATPEPLAEPAAAATVERLHDALLEAMREGETLGYAGRFERLQPVVEATYDLPSLARVALGRHWSSLDAGQQAAFVDAFGRFSVANYAARFASYGGERFETRAVERLQGEQVAVRTVLIKGDGGSVSLDYVLHPRDGQWGIVNVVADGVSELAMRRAEYGSLMKQSGFEGLLSVVEERIARLAAGGN